MEKKLGMKPILTQVPLENGQLIDLINLEILTFDSKGNVEMNKIGLDKTVSLSLLHPNTYDWSGLFLAVNHDNHKNWVSSILSHNLCLISMGMKQTLKRFRGEFGRFKKYCFFKFTNYQYF